jgi:MFS family permease
VSSIVSSTIVNVAIPDLSRHFLLGQERAQWVAASFMIAMTLSMLLTPWLLNRYGLRRTFIGALALLGAGGLIGGVAHLRRDAGDACGRRHRGGHHAAAAQYLHPARVRRTRAGQALSLFGFGVVLAPAVGPSVGGFLVETFGWRSIFFVVVPLTLIALAMARRFMAVDSAMMGERKPLDWRGLMLVGVATVSLLNGLVEMRGDVHSGIGLVALGVVMLADSCSGNCARRIR